MGENADIVNFEDDGSYWITCWNCGGAGYHEDECVCQSVEDTCCCAAPEPPICRECKGKGALHVQKPETEASDA